MSDDVGDDTGSFPLRRGGRVDLTDEALLVAADENVRVRYADVEEITIESFDWFLGVMSVALVGFGVLTLEGNALGGAAFVAAGVASLYWTYRKRGKVTVSVTNRPKPLTFCLTDENAFHEQMAEALDSYAE